MNSIIFTAGIVLVWLSSLLNGTGLGDVYHTDRITIAMLVGLSVAFSLNRRQLKIPKDVFFAFGGTVCIFAFSELFHGKGFGGMQYLCCFLLIYIFSKIKVKERAMQLSGLVVLALGIAILVIYDYGTQLSGWNENSIAMIGLFSYILFMASFYNLRSHWSKFLILLAGGLVFWLTIPTDSRSCMIVLAITILLALIMKPCPRVLRSRGWVTFFLLIPLLVAVITVVLSLSGAISNMDLWSQNTFNKPIFNGRDQLWIDGLRNLLRWPLFGSGDISANSWHNTAVACLTGFGILGYAFWLKCLYLPLKRGSLYLSDPIVTGCITAFLLMNVQQSFELGMFSPNPNLLIYLPLGLLLGRVRYLKERQ